MINFTTRVDHFPPSHAVTKNYTQQNTEILGYDTSLTSGGSEYEDTFGAHLKKHGGDKDIDINTERRPGSTATATPAISAGSRPSSGEASTGDQDETGGTIETGALNESKETSNLQYDRRRSNDGDSKRRRKKRKLAIRASVSDNGDSNGERDNLREFQLNRTISNSMGLEFCPFFLKNAEHEDYGVKDGKEGKFYRTCTRRYIPRQTRRTHTKPVQCGSCNFRGDAGQVKEHLGKAGICPRPVEDPKDINPIGENDKNIEEKLKDQRGLRSTTQFFDAIFGPCSEDDQYAKNFKACAKVLPEFSEILKEYSKQKSEAIWTIAHEFRGFRSFLQFSKQNPDVNFDALGVESFIEMNVMNTFASMLKPWPPRATAAPIQTNSTHDLSGPQTYYQSQLPQTTVQNPDTDSIDSRKHPALRTENSNLGSGYNYCNPNDTYNICSPPGVNATHQGSTQSDYSDWMPIHNPISGEALEPVIPQIESESQDSHVYMLFQSPDNWDSPAIATEHSPADLNQITTANSPHQSDQFSRLQYSVNNHESHS
ncbi:hypothetical protein DFP73DRAFT_606270 [Morchella snyderi]|nr:hypothetical protein DFP73DRAFT_606270 [Morchella snyderi]